MIRREYRDDVCYWVNVHEEGSLNIIDAPAPVHTWDDPDEKHLWTQIWAPKIAVAYRAKKGKECVSVCWRTTGVLLVIIVLSHPQPERRTKDDCRKDAEIKKKEIRTANYENFE